MKAVPDNQEHTEYAIIDIELKKKKIDCGAKVKGEFRIKILRRLDAATITCSLIGREWCRIDKSNPQDKDAEEIKDFINKPIVFANKQDFYQDATFKQDFEFDTPDDIPAAFEADYSSARGFIKYFIMINIDSPQINQTSWKKFKVVEDFKDTSTKAVAAEGTVQGYCYANKGRLVMKGTVNPLPEGKVSDGTIEGKIEVDNRGCPHNIKTLKAQMQMTVHFRAKDKVTSRYDTIVQWTTVEIKASELKNIDFKQPIPFNERFKTLASSRKGSLMQRDYALIIVPDYDTFTCCVPTIASTFEVSNIKLHKKKDHKH